MDTIYFSLDNLMPVVWACCGASLLAAVWLLAVYRPVIALKGKGERQSAEGDVSDAGLPPLSVIVHAFDNPESLAVLLGSVFSQDYPAPFEVIVVNDGSSEDVTDVVNRMAVEHRNLYQTFVPDEAHNLSRKKLGVSLGIKAARNECVVLTCAESRIASNRWLREMAAPFSRGKGVVLGFASLKGLRGAMTRFDEALVGVKWLSAALRGKPYRGTGYNIAYRRSLFFNAKGFSRSLNFSHGDDDLFIHQIANGENTAVVLSADSLVEVEFFDPAKSFRELRLRHSFTGRFLPKTTGRLLGLSTVMMWVWLAATVAGCVFSLPNALPSCWFLALIPFVWIPLVMAWRKTSARLGIGLCAWKLPCLMMWRWVRNLRFKMACGRPSRRNYTWLQH